jgi:hypothetical protein
MPIELADALENIQLALGRIPSALLVMALLGGPTLGYILYRVLEAQRAGPFQDEVPPEFWACTDCDSLNRPEQEFCYRCGSPAELAAMAEESGVGVGVMAAGSGNGHAFGVPVMGGAEVDPMASDLTDGPRPVVVRATARTAQARDRASAGGD